MVEYTHLWGYDPSLPLCIIALSFFGLSTAWHIAQNAKYKQKFFIAFVIGGIFQVIGYIGRIVCRQHLTSLGPYIVQTLFILLAPILYAASIYGLLGRMIRYLGEERKIPVKSTIITLIFVTVDIISFILQCSGGALEASGEESDRRAGTDIVLVGLGIQIAFFVFFIFLVVLFDLRTLDKKPSPSEPNWKLLLRILEISCIIILIRSIYRIIEFAGGYDGYVMTHEVFFYVFDSLMMLIVQLLYNIMHPGVVLTHPKPQSRPQIQVEVPSVIKETQTISNV